MAEAKEMTDIMPLIRSYLEAKSVRDDSWETYKAADDAMNVKHRKIVEYLSNSCRYDVRQFVASVNGFFYLCTVIRSGVAVKRIEINRVDAYST